MRTEIVKTFVLFGLFIMTFCIGILPVKIVKYVRNRSGAHLQSQAKYRRTVSFLSCFAAGVFLATCLLELLPSVRKDLTKVLLSLKTETKFPLAEFVMTFGLFTILIIEQIILSYKEHHMSQSNITKPLIPKNKPAERQKFYDRSVSIEHEHSISGISDEPITTLEEEHRTVSDNFIDDAGNYNHEYHSRAFHAENDSDNEHEHEEFGQMEHNHSVLRSVLLLIALSVHSLFEGLAVGLQRNNEKVLGIFAALVLHKCILSFSLGMNIVQSKLSYWAMIRSILIFSVSSPIGIAVGIGIIDLWDSKISTLVQGLLQGIACGTFLYVTFFEVLPHEFNSKDMRLLKVVFLLLGFGTVTGLLFLELNR